MRRARPWAPWRLERSTHMLLRQRIPATRAFFHDHALLETRRDDTRFLRLLRKTATSRHREEGLLITLIGRGCARTPAAQAQEGTWRSSQSERLYRRCR